MGKQEDKWISKFVIIDAMTEVMVTRSWRPPKHASSESEWDADAEKTCSRIMLSLGSRWLTCYAKCNVKNRLLLSTAIQKRMIHLKSLAKETELFKSGFSVIMSLSRHGENEPDAAKEVLKSCSNLYRSILRRRLHHVKLSNSDRHAGTKYHEVYLKDSIMLPFLQAVKDQNTPYCKESSIVMRCHGLSSKCAFYHDPSIDNWKGMFENNRNKQILTPEDVKDSFTYIQLSLSAKYSFSTRRKQKFEKVAKFTMCYFHIAFFLAMDYEEVSRDAFTSTDCGLDFIQKMLKEYRGKTSSIESCVFSTCRTLIETFTNFFTGKTLPQGTNPNFPKHIKEEIYRTWPKILTLLKFAWGIKKKQYDSQKDAILNELSKFSSDENMRNTHYVYQELSALTLVVLKPTTESAAMCWACPFVRTKESYKRMKMYAKIMNQSLNAVCLLLPVDNIEEQLKKESEILKLHSTNISSSLSNDNKVSKSEAESNNVPNGSSSLASTVEFDRDKLNRCKGRSGYLCKWAKYGPNHQLSLDKKYIERIEKGNPELANWYECQFEEAPLGIQISCRSGRPVVSSVSKKVSETQKGIRTGDVIHSIGNKYVQDLWRFLPLNIRQEDYLIRDNNDSNKLVPCQYIVKKMQEEFKRYMNKVSYPVRLGFIRNT